jgi:hypothetical protein
VTGGNFAELIFMKCSPPPKRPSLTAKMEFKLQVFVEDFNTEHQLHTDPAATLIKFFLSFFF